MRADPADGIAADGDGGDPGHQLGGAVERAELILGPAGSAGGDQRDRDDADAVGQSGNQQIGEPGEAVPGQRIAQRRPDQRQPCTGVRDPVLGVRFAFRPGQPALANPFAHPDDVNGHEHHQKSAGDIGGAGAEGINHGPG